MVIWLLGLSGSGKTTLGNLLYAYYKDKNEKLIFIDGDEFRDFFDNDLGYSEEERRENIKRVIGAAKVSSQLANKVIVCNISPFEDLRKFCRKKLPSYFEVYLFKPLEVLSKLDVKGIYSREKDKDIVGKGLPFEPPINADLSINTAENSIEISLEKLIHKIGK